MTRIAAALVVIASAYLLGLGVLAFARPDRARQFLAGFASSARVHFLELAARLLVGGALVIVSSDMRYAAAFLVFGWVLVGTSLGLLLIPWRLHHRFAAWSVPLATQNMPLFGVGAFVGGAVLLASLLVGRGAG